MADWFEDVRSFVAVVQAGGFEAGAKRLGLVKSAVNRSTRPIDLTDAGAEFYERGVRLLAVLQEAEDAASRGAHEVVGRLRASARVSFTAHCLAPVLGEFMARHPRLRVDIDANDRLAGIVGEGFDLAVRISRLDDSALIARRITTIRHVCCTSLALLGRHGRPQAPADLARLPGIAYANVDLRRYWLFRGGASVAVDCALTLNNGDAIREAAVAGLGAAMLPTLIAHDAIRRGELEAILTPFARPPIAMYAVHPSSRNVPAKLRLFIDFLAKRFGDEPFWARASSRPRSCAGSAAERAGRRRAPPPGATAPQDDRASAPIACTPLTGRCPGTISQYRQSSSRLRAGTCISPAPNGVAPRPRSTASEAALSGCTAARSAATSSARNAAATASGAASRMTPWRW